MITIKNACRSQDRVMLYLSSIFIQEKDIESFDELIEAVKVRAQEGEIFIRLDLKPPYPDTPKDWEEKIETAFNGYLK